MEQLHNESIHDNPDESQKPKDEHKLLDVTTDLSEIPAYRALGITNPHLTQTTLLDVFEYMRWSGELKIACEQIRATPDDDARRNLKTDLLPYFVLAKFKDNTRNKENFLSAKFMILDLDHLAEKFTALRTSLLNDPRIVILFTSPSGDGLKLVLEFDRAITTVEEYERLYKVYAERISKEYDVSPDPTCVEAARACFQSYDTDAFVGEKHELLSTNCVDDPEVTKIRKATRKPKEKPAATVIDKPVTEVSTKKRDMLSALNGQRTGFRTDSLTKQIGMYLKWGFTRDMTLAAVKPWNQQNDEPLPNEKLEYTVTDMYKRYMEEDRYEPFWSYGSDVFQFGMSGDEFYMTQIGRRKFEILINAKSKDECDEVFKHLVKHKHLPYLKRVDDIGDIAAAKSFYEVDEGDGVITVHHRACPEELKDNRFIEDYLERVFGSYAGFIKEWLAVYVYSNYRKLPTILLKGPRGTGKNLFAELLISIYPSLSQFWHGKEKNFSPEVEKKLLVADESVSCDEGQYRMLKKYSGQGEATVNQKYMREYKVKNNMNILILSNSERPIFVERMELPTDEKNNQFFVYAMKKFAGPVDVELPVKLKSRLGHYIRTELKTVYDRVKDRTDCRYSIPVPITDEEKSLFDLNKSDLDEEVDKILDQIQGPVGQDYEKFFEAGYLPKIFVTNYNLPHKLTKTDIYRRLKERGYCEPSESVDDEPRPKFDGKRERCLVMTEKMKTRYAAA